MEKKESNLNFNNIKSNNGILNLIFIHKNHIKLLKLNKQNKSRTINNLQSRNKMRKRTSYINV